MRKSRKPKVLCLGLSYADVEGQLSKIQRDGKDRIFRDCRDGSVDSVIHSVRRSLLTEMDGRDLARCISTEELCGVDVYTVSQEKGAVYREDRHLDANFNRHDFIRNLRKKFGEDCCFDEIILDYFWIPQGWDASHWSKSFFEKTLVAFAAENILRERTGAIYLPFCLHCFKFVHICFDKLKQYYNVSFIRKNELKKVSLWRGTQSIDSFDMQHFLGKNLYQEDIYCTFGPKDIAEAMEDSRVSKTELIELATSLEDFHSIRFLCLKLLPGKRPAISNQTFGSFIGCSDPLKVRRGFYYMGVDAVSNTRAGRNIVGKYSLSPARSRRTIKAGTRMTRIRRSLFPTGEQGKTAFVSESSNSDGSIESLVTGTVHSREGLQTHVKVTPNSTPISEKSRLRKRTRPNRSTLNGASQTKDSSISPPPARNNVLTQFSSSSRNTASHRYPTRRLVSLVRAAVPAYVTPVKVAAPDVSDSSNSSRNKRNRSKSLKSSHLSPRDLFPPSSGTDAFEKMPRYYVDVTFEGHPVQEAHPSRTT